MAKHKVEDIRNIAVVGHGAVGKTTLVDRMLMKAGAVQGQHSVDAGTSVCDFDPEEKTHKYSIEAKLTHFNWHGKRFNVLDTPGYPDFIGQAIGALNGVDLAVIVINAHVGISVNTRRVWQEAEKAGVGRVIVLNRMDEENIDFPALLASLEELWGKGCALFNVPIGSGHGFKGVVDTLATTASVPGALIDPPSLHDQLLESIVQTDAAVLERFFDGKLPTEEEVAHLVEHGIAERALYPILCCSAKNDVGVTELMDFLAADGPSPLDVRRVATKDGQEHEIKPDPNGPLVARVFRTRIDPFVQKLSFIRVYSGHMKRDDLVHASATRKSLKLGPLLEVCGAESHAIEEAGPGDIIAIAKTEELHTGTVLGDYSLPSIEYPRPMVGLAVAPKSHNDEAKLSGAIHKVAEEDPTFHYSRDPQTHELIVTGMTDLHLKIVQERLHRREKLDIDTKVPKIPFRETIQANAEGSYRHKKQTGGRGQFGEVHIRMMPFPEGTPVESFVTKERFPSMREYHFDKDNQFVWVNSIVGGSIPGNFLPAIEKGFKERMARGVIAGYQVQNVCVEVHYGKHHEVDSSEAAFKTAGSMAFRDVFREASPALLEPIVKLAITVPESSVGDVFSDLSSRGGHVRGQDAAGGGFVTINAEAPFREVTTYARTLSSMTGGQGSFTIEFAHYAVMPANIQQEIIAKAQLHEPSDE
ncbi:MAG TPA: elongation factor G [Pirellulaceae bacterium]|nr:elongation factor G [Pirellulaceae bacterium]